MAFNFREKLKEQLCEYIFQTLGYAKTVKKFCDRESIWTTYREIELNQMKDIGTKPDSTEEELREVLRNTLNGLEELHHFLDAVEKLAVTSLSVFISDSFMPSGVSSMYVRSVISAARTVSPLLVPFKRDAGTFFRPSLSNVEVLALQLTKYIEYTNNICEEMNRSNYISGSGGGHEWTNRISSLTFILNMSEESVQPLFEHLLQLIKIRKDESFKMTFLFGVKAQDFINIFSECRARMLQFLSGLKEAAVQLDRMKKGSDISGVAGSSLGIAGGLCSIVGLALAPVTAGLSLGLTVTGFGLGVTSGLNSLVTGITEMGVTTYHCKKANDLFIKFMEDVQKILDCVNDVINSADGIEAPDGVADTVLDVGRLSVHSVLSGRSIDEIGQVANGASVTLSRSVRVGLIGLNVLFIGVDIISIYKDSMSLAKGSQNKAAQIIHSRAALWNSEVEAWKKIHDHLHKGLLGFSRNQEILNNSFYI